MSIGPGPLLGIPQDLPLSEYSPQQLTLVWKEITRHMDNESLRDLLQSKRPEESPLEKRILEVSKELDRHHIDPFYV